MAHLNITKKRKLLENSYNEQVSLENIIQRTAQHYREAHTERKHLVGNWKEAVTAMNSRNNEIKILTDVSSISFGKENAIAEQICLIPVAAHIFHCMHFLLFLFSVNLF